MHAGTIPCTYVSVWDDEIEIESPAMLDLKTREVFNIAQADLSDATLNSLEILTRQYVRIYIPVRYVEYDVYEDDGRYFIKG